ncbi:hypothetical protein GCM10027426_08930 [Microbacterium lacusdiani]
MTRLGRVVDLITEKGDDADLRLGLEAIEGGTGRRLVTTTEYAGEGVSFTEGDILFGKLRPYLAKSWLADQPGVAVGDFHVYRPRRDRVDPRYLLYVTLSSAFLDPVVSSVQGAKMPRASWEFVRNVEIVLPSIARQRAIADYLDRETAQIDTLIAKQESLVGALRLRASVLTERAVTRGIQPAVATRETSISWLQGAHVPRHWGTSRVKYLVTSMRAGETITSDVIEPTGEFSVYGGNGLRGYTTTYTHAGTHVLIGRQGALCGNVHLVRGRFWASEHAIVCTPRDDIDALWLAHVLRVMNLGQYSMTSAQPGIGVSQIAPLEVPYPPLEEQRAIAAYLDEQSAKIDALIAKAQQFIALAKERRAALITAAVTGQIDVTTGKTRAA